MNKIKIIAGLIITKPIPVEEEKACLMHLESFINQVDYLYIYNFSGDDLESYLKLISKFANIDYTVGDDLGEARNYEIIYQKAIEEKADFGLVLTPYHFYEEEAFLNLKKFAMEPSSSTASVITPLPLRGSEPFEKKAEYSRNCLGCQLNGALVNMKIYQEVGGIRTDFYQTTFDYEYCLKTRAKGYYVIVLQNDVYRNLDYKTIEKRILTLKRYTYEIDIFELYYLTRNRLYLWKEYEKIDPKYVKLDKKIAHQELQEVRLWDPMHRDKMEIVKKAKDDFKHNVLGKI
jgi:hypothetical protein